MGFRSTDKDIRQGLLYAFLFLIALSIASLFTNDFTIWKLLSLWVGFGFVLGLMLVVLRVRKRFPWANKNEPDQDTAKFRSRLVHLSYVRFMAIFILAQALAISAIVAVLSGSLWVIVVCLLIGLSGFAFFMGSWLLNRKVMEEAGFEW